VTQKTFKKLLKPGRHKLVNFVRREQGLMIAPGNPHRITGVHDLAHGQLRYVNRDPGSGTRVEFDQMLARLAINSNSIRGYERSEPTHLAVAAAIAAGQADAGMGIRAAAHQFGLDFVPLLNEQYYFACLKDTLAEPAMQRLLQLLRGAQWRSLMDDLPGYDPNNAGEVVSLKEALPWYQFKTEKPRAPQLNAA
jgi:putative molybdopterin biosynthesis protein